MQVFIFLTCVLLGVGSGVLYDILFIARAFVCGVNKSVYTVKDKIFTCICDIIYFLAFAVAFVFISVCFEFYSVRLYMLAGCALGAIIYMKSLHLIIAFLIKKVYNGINRSENTARKKKWAKKNATE